MKRLKDWSVKELVDGYGDSIPDLNCDMKHIDALHAVLNYEVESYNEKYADEIGTVSDEDDLLELIDEDDESFTTIPQY